MSEPIFNKDETQLLLRLLDEEAARSGLDSSNYGGIVEVLVASARAKLVAADAKAFSTSLCGLRTECLAKRRG